METTIAEENQTYIDDLNIIKNNAEQAQQIKGALTMPECEKFLDSIGELVKFFEKNPTKNNIGNDYVKEAIKHVDFIIDMLSKFNATGVFGMAGSKTLLTKIKGIYGHLASLKKKA